jgi:hypothetical protein
MFCQMKNFLNTHVFISSYIFIFLGKLLKFYIFYLKLGQVCISYCDIMQFHKGKHAGKLLTVVWFADVTFLH